MTKREKPIFDAVRNRKFGRFTCFLCGCRLGKRNRSEEHVFPRWLQERFQLPNKQLVLLNGSSIPYRQLTIPCCKRCNNEHLSPIEKKIKLATARGVAAVRQVDPIVLFLWLGKIFYGLLYREYLLKLDRKSASRKTIIPREVLDRFGMHHLMLQASRLRFRFMCPAGADLPPASVLVLRTQKPKLIEHQFDFRDSPAGMLISLRMGKVGIIAALQDGGALELLGFPKCRRYALHPIQFQELTAQIFYKTGLLNRTPKFLVAEDSKSVSVIMSPLAGLSTRPIFDDWQQPEYARVLSAMTGISVHELFFPPRVMSFLRGKDGKLLFIDVNDESFGPTNDCLSSRAEPEKSPRS